MSVFFRIQRFTEHDDAGAGFSNSSHSQTIVIPVLTKQDCKKKNHIYKHSIKIMSSKTTFAKTSSVLETKPGCLKILCTVTAE